jgi:hypothetical protein
MNPAHRLTAKVVAAKWVYFVGGISALYVAIVNISDIHLIKSDPTLYTHSDRAVRIFYQAPLYLAYQLVRRL